MIGTPSQYSPSKLIGLHSPKELELGSYFQVIKDGSVTVGSLYVKKYKNSYIIRDVFVLPSARGRGIGKQLMTEILRFLQPKKLPIQLYVDSTNAVAINLYTALGFKLIKQGAAHGDKYEFRPL